MWTACTRFGGLAVRMSRRANFQAVSPRIEFEDGTGVDVDEETAAEVRSLWEELRDAHPDRAVEYETRDGERRSSQLRDISAVDDGGA